MINFKSVARAGVCTVVLGLGGVASAASYPFPWYVNPTLRFRIDNNLAAGIKPSSVAVSGKWFFMANDASDAVNLRALDEDTALSRDIEAAAPFGADQKWILKDGSIANLFTHGGTGKSTDYGLPAAPVVAVDGAGERLLAVDSELSVARLFNAKRDVWGLAGKANAPVELGISGSAPKTDCILFGADGRTLFSNRIAGDDRGTLAKWTLSGATLTRGADLATGLSAVRGFAVWTLDGVEYAVVGEGDGTAATKGQVRLVKLSDGSQTTLIDDATNLSTGIAAIRVSHADFFRPRVYALLETGDIVCYFYRKEKSTCHWTETFTNAKLLEIVRAPYAGDMAKVTHFAVSASGELALVGYTPADGVSAQGSEKATFAFLAHTATPWTYYAQGAEGSPCQDYACITDGKWVLTMASKNKIGATNGSGDAYYGDYMGEYLDLSAGYAVDSANPSTKNDLSDYSNWSLGTNKVSRGPRVMIQSSKFNGSWSQFTKGWWGEGNYEEICLANTRTDFTRISSWAGFAPNQKFVVVSLPAVTLLCDTSFYGNNSQHMCGNSRWEDFSLPNLQSANKRALGFYDASGTLTLPSAKYICAEAFYHCNYMEGLVLAETSKTLAAISNSAFRATSLDVGHLKRVVLGCAANCFLDASVFENQPLEEVVLTGARPTVKATSCWSDQAELKITFAVPKDDPVWAAALDGKVAPLTDAERQAFHLVHPGRCVPYGIVAKDVLNTNYRQYVADLNDCGYCKLKLEYDEFFGDAVNVTADREPASDGTYLTGTKISLTAVPDATGTFRKWYGGPFRDNDEARQASVEFTISEDTWLYCRITHPWRLSSDKTTMSNGNFTINCTSVNTSKHTLSASKTEKCGLYAEDDSGYGVCDLGGDVFAEGDATPYTINGIATTGGSMCGKRGGKGNAKALLVPEKLTAFPGSQFLHATTGSWTGRSYETLIFDCPNVSGGWGGGWTTCGNFDLDHLIIQCPKLGYFSSEASFWNMPLRETRFDWWNVRGVYSVAYSALAGYDWSHYCGAAKGNLELPSLRGVQRGGDNNRSAFQTIKGLESVVLGGADKTCTFQSLTNYAFSACSALRKVTIYNDANMFVGTTPFNNCTSLKEIVLQGRVLSETAMQNLLSSVTAAATKPVKVYVSSGMGWANRPSYIDAPTEAERAEAPGEFVLGVYRGGAAAPNGKALLIHRAGPFDPRGTYLFLR